MLPPGLYEQVINTALNRELSEIPDARKLEKSRTVQNLNTPNMKLTRPGLWRPDETSQAADHLD